jgi:cobaltochelatase CobN
LQDFFERTNPYALQEMTAVMLETARKGYWKPDAQVLRDTARLHADLVARHGASGTGFVNDNAALRAFIAERLDKDVLPRYEDALQQANEGGVIDTANGLVLRKQEDPTAARPSAGQPGAEPVQEPARQSEPEAVSPAYRYAAPVGALLALLAALAGVILWIRRRHAAQEFHA